MAVHPVKEAEDMLPWPLDTMEELDEFQDRLEDPVFKKQLVNIDISVHANTCLVSFIVNFQRNVNCL